MAKKLIIFCLFAVIAGLSLRAQAQSYPQVDTLVFKRDSLDMARGVMYTLRDTVYFRYAEEDLFFAVDLTPEMTFFPLTIKPLDIKPAKPVIKTGDSIAKARSLRLDYRFEDAVRYSQIAIEQAVGDAERADAEKEYSYARNGLNLTDNCAMPVPVEKKRFSVKDFYLYYPFADRSFRSAPNAFERGTGIAPTYIPRNARRAFYSSVDEGGSRNLYMSENQDTCWSAPKLLGESLLSLGNEITPVLSPDGLTLYFASDGLFGMGGYDLYSSSWNEQTKSWNPPENMGFPYSSPYDDFLLMQTDDGRYTIFASNRECSADSVYVYVLQYDASPRRVAVSDPAELKELSFLAPSAVAASIDNTSIVSSGGFDSGTVYMEAVNRVGKLTAQVEKLSGELAALNRSFEQSADETVRETLRGIIKDKTAELEQAKSDKKTAETELEAIEGSFTSSSFLNTGRVADAADAEIVGAGGAYAFTKRKMGSAMKVKVLPWKQHPGSVFKVSPVGRFGAQGSLPEGLYYQIRFLDTMKHATVDDFNGLGPVYERQTRRLHYLYYAGVFTRYQDALHQLNAVRRLGFPDAEICAYNGTAPIALDIALEMEAAIVDPDN